MAQYKKFNITRAEKYTTSKGEEKTAWRNVGMITLFLKQDGSESGICQLDMFSEEYQVFPFVLREQQNSGGYNNQGTQPQNNGGVQYPKKNINPEDIPF